MSPSESESTEVTVELVQNVVEVEFSTNEVVLTAPGPQGPPGPPGPAGGAIFSFEQTASVNHWVIEHNLGRYPNVIVTEIDGVPGRYGCDISDIDLNTTVLDFLEPHIGKAELE